MTKQYDYSEPRYENQHTIENVLAIFAFSAGVSNQVSWDNYYQWAMDFCMNEHQELWDCWYQLGRTLREFSKHDCTN